MLKPRPQPHLEPQRRAARIVRATGEQREGADPHPRGRPAQVVLRRRDRDGRAAVRRRVRRRVRRADLELAPRRGVLAGVGVRAGRGAAALRRRGREAGVEVRRVVLGPGLEAAHFGGGVGSRAARVARAHGLRVVEAVRERVVHFQVVYGVAGLGVDGPEGFGVREDANFRHAVRVRLRGRRSACAFWGRKGKG